MFLSLRRKNNSELSFTSLKHWFKQAKQQIVFRQLFLVFVFCHLLRMLENIYHKRHITSINIQLKICLYNDII